MAEAPALLKGYFTLSEIFRESSFSAGECEFISLCISRWNNCHYCIPAHATLAKAEKMPAEVIAALREDKPIPDERLESLRRFINVMLDKRGWPDEADLQAFYDAGYTKANVLEVILGIGLNTLSNYTNHVAKTPIDEAFAGEK
jgi:AhpD family alkylhydroperoxidase